MRINLTDPRLSPTASCLSKRGRRPKPTPLRCSLISRDYCKGAPCAKLGDLKPV